MQPLKVKLSLEVEKINTHTMPTYIHLANFVFDKKTIAQKYKGGCAQFRIDWNIEGENHHQEEQLVNL